MTTLKTILLCACCIALTEPAWSQASDGSFQGIPGYLDPKTGTFKPMATVPLAEGEATPLVAATAGDFKVTFNITVKSAIPATATIVCTFVAAVVDIGNRLSMTDSMSVAATGTGASRTCNLDMFYSWPLASPGSDTVALNYSISTGGSTTALTRLSSQSLPSKSPAPSGTTSMTITATI